ncbi:MAG: dihydropteroate synthase [Betaproteobacteria bacterium]|nr:dihydropteroate synthase [Betaproteobacteria bacterium]
MYFWHTSRFRIDLSKPRVMGIVNITPDSFSDGGHFASTSSALAQGEALLREGADILDLGAESTRPGALALSEDQELARLLPVLREAVRWGVPISVDTYKPGVMQAALDVGADIINDVWALRWVEPGSARTGVDVLANHGSCGVCLMHMHGDPATMQVSPMQGDALAPVMAFLQSRIAALQARAVGPERMVIDPGIGFGKTVEQNFSLLARQSALLALGVPVLAGWSRKSSLGAVTGAGPADRVVASATAAALAVQQGARVVRVHDVHATVQALQVLAAVQVA